MLGWTLTVDRHTHSLRLTVNNDGLDSNRVETYMRSISSTTQPWQPSSLRLYLSLLSYPTSKAHPEPNASILFKFKCCIILKQVGPSQTSSGSQSTQQQQRRQVYDSNTPPPP